MQTTIEIDDSLVQAAVKALGTKSRREAVEQALETAIRLRRQESILQLRGIGWDGDLDDMRTSKYVPEDE